MLSRRKQFSDRPWQGRLNPGKSEFRKLVRCHPWSALRGDAVPRYNNWSILAARMKSLSVRPLILCVQVVISAFPQVRKMSG